MDVNLTGVREPIQEFIHALIEINDWTFYESRIVDDILGTPPPPPPQATVGQLLRCFGSDWDMETRGAALKFSATPAKGPHACGTLQASMKDPIQFCLGSSKTQLYLSPIIEIWYLVNRGLHHNAVKIDTFDRLGLVFFDGRHRGIRNIIMGDDRVDIRMSDEEGDIVSLYVAN